MMRFEKVGLTKIKIGIIRAISLISRRVIVGKVTVKVRTKVTKEMVNVMGISKNILKCQKN